MRIAIVAAGFTPAESDQHDRRDEAVLQFAQHVANLLRVVLGEGDLHLRRPGPAFLRYQGADLIDGLDDVLAGALGYLDADGGQAVDARDRFVVLEGAAQTGDVLDLDNRIAADLDRHRENVRRGFEQARYLDGEPALAGVHHAGGHQPVGPRDDGADLVQRQSVGLDPQRIDDELDQQQAEPTLKVRQHASMPVTQRAGIAMDVDDGALALFRRRVPRGQDQAIGGADRLLAHEGCDGGIDEVQRTDAGAVYMAALCRPQEAQGRQIDESGGDDDAQHKSQDAFPPHDGSPAAPAAGTPPG